MFSRDFIKTRISENLGILSDENIMTESQIEEILSYEGEITQEHLFWGDEMTEFYQIVEGRENITEASRRKAAAIGFVIGGLAGAAIGSGLAKGKQRTLQDQIDSGKKKIQKWSADGSDKSKEKVKRMQEKIRLWQNHLEHLKHTGQGDAGMFRTSYKDKMDERNQKEAKKSGG